jgi:hypothetical protein
MGSGWHYQAPLAADRYGAGGDKVELQKKSTAGIAHSGEPI